MQPQPPSQPATEKTMSHFLKTMLVPVQRRRLAKPCGRRLAEQPSADSNSQRRRRRPWKQERVVRPSRFALARALGVVCRRINLAEEDEGNGESVKAVSQAGVADATPAPAIAAAMEELPIEAASEEYTFAHEDYDMMDGYPAASVVVCTPPSTQRRGRQKSSSGGADPKSRLYQGWHTLLPELEGPLLRFLATSCGPQPRPPNATPANFGHGGCARSYIISCVYWDREYIIRSRRLPDSVGAGVERRRVCACFESSVGASLVARGLFPSSPIRPAYAFCIELLELYLKMFEQSCGSLQGFAAALHSFHLDRGHVLTHKDVSYN